MRLRLGPHIIEAVRSQPVIMGIVNVTPDSVSDTVHLRDLEAQVAYARGLLEAGARIIDVGGESGRTDVAPVSADEERARVVPLVRELAASGVAVSVDTYKPVVAAAAVEAGASMINDVSGLADERIADVAAASGAGLVIMHTRASPKVESFPRYLDPVEDVLALLASRADAARARGVADDQLIFDPGLDFAKTPAQTISVLAGLPELAALDRPILLAVSRKYFIGMITGRPPQDRLAGTLAAVEAGVAAGATLLRVHDVAHVNDFLAVRRALSAGGEPHLKGQPDDPALKWITRS